MKLASILEEVSALESKLEKVASHESSPDLASFLDKIAEDAENDEDEKEDNKKGESKKDEKEKEDESEKSASKKSTQEADMKLSDNDITKIAYALKNAVLDNEQTQGSTVSGSDGSSDGAATNAARSEDQLLPLDSVESAANSNPQRHNTSSSGDLVEDEAPNVEDMAKALKEGTIRVYTAKQAELLEKFAGIGYEHVVDTKSDEIVQEKIAQALIDEQAKDAPQKIASAMLRGRNTENQPTTKTASNETVQKLAQIKKDDPDLFSSLQVLASRGLI